MSAQPATARTEKPTAKALQAPALHVVEAVMPQQRQPQRRPRANHTGLTQPQQQACQEYLNALAQTLGLGDWDLEIEWGTPSSDGADAEIAPCENRRQATVWLTRGFAKLPAHEIRQVLVHELLHCHWAPLGQLIQKTADAVCEPSTAKIFTIATTQAEEYAVDGLSVAIARILPLPSFV